MLNHCDSPSSSEIVHHICIIEVLTGECKEVKEWYLVSVVKL